MAPRQYSGCGSEGIVCKLYAGVRGAYERRTQAYAVRSIDSHDFSDGLFLAGFLKFRPSLREFPRFLRFSDCPRVAASPQAGTTLMETLLSGLSAGARQSSGWHTLVGSLATSWQYPPLRVRLVRNSLVPPPRHGSPSCWTTWFTLRAPLLLRGPWSGCFEAHRVSSGML